MSKILIPSSLIELTGLVQQCLLLAKEQGFSIEDIELGVSPTQSIQLVRGQQTTHITTDLIDDYDSEHESSFVLCYRSALSVEACAKQPSKAIHIGIADTQVSDEKEKVLQLDIWRHPINNEVRALSVKSKFNAMFDPEHHLAWIVTLTVLDFPIEDALTLARGMLTQQANVSRETLLNDNLGEGRSTQWADQFDDFPTPVLEDNRLGIQVGWSAQGESVSFPTLTKQSLGLYPVVDDVAWIERLLPLGINTIQLRIKNPQQADLEQQIIRAIELGRQYQAQVFINDYWQLAIKHGAYGVHLGQEDIEESNLAQITKAGIRLGLSTHGYYELLRIVQIHPSYIALGHIFPTTTKQMPSKPQGLVRLALYQKLIDSIPYTNTEAAFRPSKDKEVSDYVLGFPTVAIGGIDQSNADQVWLTGVSSLAVVRAITLAESPQSVIEFFAQLMKERQLTFTDQNNELADTKRGEHAHG
ncbi:thiamine phosphate synthase [Vibrio alginolyticus]|uniref:thiamine phosphate synthase n=1 Tax=Vibrio TaxID=662 RepID=UPI001BD20B67|nr:MULTISPECIES: thiamine phosphate synthase [Vibrio]ELA7191187.1 thiamine phosphate synthase [Vibrio alginolyticus]MBS9958132.1 thiamine phosphate synthase [Vibrio alginolyticus]MDW1593469.1 thiamine phosphate synthase [Vibrio sp. Vb2944]MDW1612031.1 thiamine phosphate synthase [Vibrio sp. Vb2908]MDW1674908.1 thiamine phosphate synthase [Vibrio sp. Vb2610]